MEKLCKIYKNGKIYFWDTENKKYMLFGWIDKTGIKFNIETYIDNTLFGLQIEENMPNPPIEFYIELGEKIKEVKNGN